MLSIDDRTPRRDFRLFITRLGWIEEGALEGPYNMRGFEGTDELLGVGIRKSCRANGIFGLENPQNGAVFPNSRNSQ